MRACAHKTTLIYFFKHNYLYIIILIIDTNYITCDWEHNKVLVDPLIFSNALTNSSIETVEKLSNYFLTRNKRHDWNYNPQDLMFSDRMLNDSP
jgi:hypothetical protein